MTKAEFVQFMAFLTAATRTDLPEVTATAYYEMLKDLDFSRAMLAARKIVATMEAPVLPAIGLIRRAYAELSAPADGLTPGEAWGRVREAIWHYGSYREAEALASLPPLVRKAVECMGWRDLCLSEEPTVARAQFMRVYEQLREREAQRALLPPDVRKALEAGGSACD